MPGTLTFAVSGRVVERENGRAIGDVTVTLSPIHEAVDAAGNTVEVIPSDAQVHRLGLTSASKITTSDDGRFGFEHVAAGTYMLTAARNGYLPGLVQSDGALAPSQLLHVGSVERSTDVELRLVRPGVVSGTIVGQDNAPLVNVEVRALRTGVGGGKIPLRRGGHDEIRRPRRLPTDELSPGRLRCGGALGDRHDSVDPSISILRGHRCGTVGERRHANVWRANGTDRRVRSRLAGPGRQSHYRSGAAWSRQGLSDVVLS